MIERLHDAPTNVLAGSKVSTPNGLGREKIVRKIPQGEEPGA